MAETDPETKLRERIVAGATELLADGGRAAVTTRAVAAHVGVSPPTIYRLFGEMNGLLSAVAESGLDRFLAAKDPLQSSEDPVDDLKAGWSLTVEFGLREPELFLLTYSEPHSAAMAAALAKGAGRMHERIRRVAAAGRLGVSESLAASLMQASARGVVLTWLSQAAAERDHALIDAMRDAVFTAITTDASVVREPGRAGAARTMMANLSGQTALSLTEEALMADWLDRLTADSPDHR